MIQIIHDAKGASGIKKRIFCLFLLLACLLSTVSCGNQVEHELEIYVLDVGQGDAILLRTPEGDVLIDAGPESEQDALCYRLKTLGVKRLKLAVFTHSDEDHIGGADGVLRTFPTESVWIGDHFERNESSMMLLDAAYETEADVVRVHDGTQISVGSASVFVLYPFEGVEASSNDQSLVLSVMCGSVRALFMGDVSEKTERAMLERYPAAQLNCTLLKVAHHGSETSSSAEFVRVTSPQYAVIGCGRGNSYGHPHGVVLERLESVGARIFRTDLHGDIAFYTDGDVLTRKE